MISNEDCAYLAGLFDGEGSIGIYKEQRKDRLSPQHWIEISITNKHLDVLMWAKDTFGGRIDLCYDRGIWKWRASTKEAADILEKAFPYLKTKKSQACLVLEFQQRVNNYNAEGGKPISPDELNWRDSLKFQVSQLNQLYYSRSI